MNFMLLIMKAYQLLSLKSYHIYFTVKSETFMTPIVAATPFDYPNAVQDRYIGDAIELGYTIKTTGADDSIVHIVQ